jgi:hypothetical protein
VIDNDWKIIFFGDGPQKSTPPRFALYNLVKDMGESDNLMQKQTNVAKRMASLLHKAKASVASSVVGKDYPEGQVNQPQPPRIFWHMVDAYKPFFPEWRKRPEYGAWLKKRLK